MDYCFLCVYGNPDYPKEFKCLDCIVDEPWNYSYPSNYKSEPDIEDLEAVENHLTNRLLELGGKDPDEYDKVWNKLKDIRDKKINSYKL